MDLVGWEPMVSWTEHTSVQIATLALCRVSTDILQSSSRLDLQGTWKCKATSGNTTFDDVEFDESSEWTDYDEGAGEPVGITELEGKWVRS